MAGTAGGGGARRGTARAPHPDPPRRLRGRRAPDSRGREHDRPRPGPLFDADAYLSPRHAELSIGPNGVTVRDLQSLNGVFLKIAAEEALESGDIFRIGQELLRFEVISPPQPLEDGTEVMGTPEPRLLGSAVGHRRSRRRRLGLPAVRRGHRARPRARRHPVSRGRLRLGHARAHLAARRPGVPDRPRLVQRNVPAPAPRARPSPPARSC